MTAPVNSTADLGYFYELITLDGIGVRRQDFFGSLIRHELSRNLDLSPDPDDPESIAASDSISYTAWDENNQAYTPIFSFSYKLEEEVAKQARKAAVGIHTFLTSHLGSTRQNHAIDLLEQVKNLKGRAQKHELIPARYPFILEALQMVQSEIESHCSTDAVVNSFHYNHAYASTNLEKLHAFLAMNNLIASGIKEVTFQKAFSGVVVKTKVEWVGSNEQLYLFILKLAPLMDTASQRMKWKVAAACFKGKDGQAFSADQLRGSRVPEETIAGRDIISKAVNILK